MALTTVTLDGLDMNDHVTYWLMPGFNPGEDVYTYDEQRSYAGTVTVTNVTNAHVVELMVPIDVRCTTVALLETAIAAINTKIAGCHIGALKNFVFGGTTYQILDSNQLRPVRDVRYSLGCALLPVVLRRMPI
jgi:hypothetical protein